MEIFMLNNNLDYYETVERGNNGYPTGIKKVIMGFESWEQIQDFINQFGGTAISVHRRDGWQLWERGDKMYEPYQMREDIFGDDYRLLSHTDFSDEAEFIREEVKPQIDDLSSFNDLEEIVDSAHTIWAYLEEKNDEKLILTYKGHLYEYIEKNPITYSYDTHNYTIGVLCD